MVRVILGVIAGFFAWVILWVGIERILSTLMPEWYGVHQQAFEAVVDHGGPFAPDKIPFMPDTAFLITQIVSASIVSVISGFLAALIAGENKRAPLVLGFLLLGLGILKAVGSWPFVPIWYHVIFTAILLPMAMLGGRLKTTTK